jgi:N-acetylneuraminic acid mutarotase
MPVILGVLLSACQSFLPDKDTEVAQPTQTATIPPTIVVPTATVIVPTAVRMDAGPAPVEPTAIPMAITSGMFQPGFPLAIPRTKHTATLLQNGKILIVGGSVEPDDFVLDEEIIDPSNGSSSWTAPLHTPRHDHTATLLQDGRVLVVGGYNLPLQWIGDAEIYNPRSELWTVISPNYTHGTSHTATLMKDGRVLVVGGCIGSYLCTNKVEIFDPGRDVWLEATPLIAERAGQTAQLLDDGRVLIAGGYTAYNEIPADGSAVIFNPQTNTWSETEPMKAPRTFSQSVKLLNGDVLVAGGIRIGSDPPQTINAVEIYDPDTNRWREVQPLSQARYAFFLSSLPSGDVIAIAGSRDWDSFWSQNSFVKEIEEFDPASEQWSVIGELPQPGAYFAGIQIMDGRIFVTGGNREGSWVLDENWLIQP